jgi:hypothetical protein
MMLVQCNLILCYLQDLSKYGITPDHVANSGCYAYDLAAWRVRLHIKNDKGDIWTKAANYHSRTPKYNAKYRADLIVKGGQVGGLAGRPVFFVWYQLISSRP